MCGSLEATVHHLTFECPSGSPAAVPPDPLEAKYLVKTVPRLEVHPRALWTRQRDEAVARLRPRLVGAGRVRVATDGGADPSIGWEGASSWSVAFEVLEAANNRIAHNFDLSSGLILGCDHSPELAETFAFLFAAEVALALGLLNVLFILDCKPVILLADGVLSGGSCRPPGVAPLLWQRLRCALHALPERRWDVCWVPSHDKLPSWSPLDPLEKAQHWRTMNRLVDKECSRHLAAARETKQQWIAGYKVALKWTTDTLRTRIEQLAAFGRLHVKGYAAGRSGGLYTRPYGLLLRVGLGLRYSFLRPTPFSCPCSSAPGMSTPALVRWPSFFVTWVSTDFSSFGSRLAAG